MQRRQCRPGQKDTDADDELAFEDLLKQWVEVRSISADPDRKADVGRMAELGAETIRRFGGKADIHRVDGGNPIVVGGLEAGPGLPTVTIYNHLDVQPASMETEPWKSEPFVFTKNGDRYFLFSETGDLIIAKLTKEAYEEISRAHILEPTGEAFGRAVVWSHPAYANKCAFVRNDKELVCVSLAK